MPSPANRECACVPLQPAPDTASGLVGYTPVQQYTLVRFTRLCQLARDVLPQLDPSDYRNKLTYKALYSTYRDLLDLGLVSEARLIREGFRVARQQDQAA